MDPFRDLFVSYQNIDTNNQILLDEPDPILYWLILKPKILIVVK